MASGMDDASGTTFEIGTSQVCYTITETEDPDSNGIQSTTCCFNVIVQDNESPVISCLPDQIISTDEGLCTAELMFIHPDSTDNCGIASLELTYSNPDGTIDGPFTVAPGGVEMRVFQLGIRFQLLLILLCQNLFEIVVVLRHNGDAAIKK